ncbi:hypothetical protein N9917_04410 [Deltaproteobacteria bacterium]|nr:hypothetical protein [Deltaproteobacteria bacterium]
MSTILDFYQGSGTGAGRTFDQIMAFDDFNLEAVHDWVQWVFPLPEKSKAQPKTCPVLTAADLEVFRTDVAVRARVHQAANRYWKFLMDTEEWHTQYDHNHLRITRLIRFLVLGWFHGLAQDILRWVSTDPRCKANDKTRWYWSEALTETPTWLETGT